MAECQKLTGSQISIGPTGLNFGDLALGEVKVLIRSDDILADGERGHAIGVVRNTTELLGALSGRERLPPASATSASVY